MGERQTDRQRDPGNELDSLDLKPTDTIHSFRPIRARYKKALSPSEIR